MMERKARGEITVTTEHDLFVCWSGVVQRAAILRMDPFKDGLYSTI